MISLEKKATAILGSIAGLLLISLIAMTARLTYADTSNQPHAADAMWVEPSSVTFDTSNATLGQKFNVTVWLNISSAWTAFSYQIALHYNRTQLQCTRTGFTAGTKSQFFVGHATSGYTTIDTSFLGNGSILASESSLDTNQSGPHADSLIWAEFQILIVPTSGSLTSMFDISKEYKLNGDGNTWVDTTGLGVYLDPLSVSDGNYLVIPEFSILLILPIFLVSTTLAVVFSRKTQRKTPI